MKEALLVRPQANPGDPPGAKEELSVFRSRNTEKKQKKQ